MRVKKCCCCVPLIYAVKILGTLDIIRWLDSAIRFDLFNFAALFVTTAMFLWMVVIDTERTRKAYFCAFLLNRLAILTLLSYYIAIPMIEDK